LSRLLNDKDGRHQLASDPDQHSLICYFLVSLCPSLICLTLFLLYLDPDPGANQVRILIRSNVVLSMIYIFIVPELETPVPYGDLHAVSPFVATPQAAIDTILTHLKVRCKGIYHP
jgi:hypothetical protein